MAFNLGGALTGGVGGAATGSSAGPYGAIGGALIGGAIGAFTGDDRQTNRDVGFSNNTQERSQRINQAQQQQQANNALIAQDLQNYFLTGQYNPTNIYIPNGGSIGNPNAQRPTGPAQRALEFGLNSENQLSGKRQDIAYGLLGQFAANNPATDNFARQQLAYGTRALPSQENLFQDAFRQNKSNEGLQSNLFGSINDFITSGGQASAAQQQNIGDIFNAQRQIGQSNLNQQFGEALRQLQDHATSRGLRFGDTPIQDRGNLTTQEFLRNAANLESSIGGNQAQALLQTPFQQQAQNLQALGQTQASNLNVLNAFSTPINQAFGQQGQQFQQGQFAANYSPASFSGVGLQNLQAYLSGGSFSQPIPSYAASQPAQYTASPQANFANQFATGLGSSAAGGVSGAIGNLASSFGSQSGGALPNSTGQAPGGSRYNVRTIG